jgi:glutamine amidotransferase
MIAIIDYGMGNLHSVLKAFERVNAKAVITSNLEIIEKSDKLVLPGVGYFKQGMDNLKRLKLIDALNKKVISKKTPILGICLGMQLLSDFSEEGNAEGLGWTKGSTIKFNLESKFRIPHMGWNSLNIKKESKLFNGLKENDLFYFVHSYHVVPKENQNVLSITNYGNFFVSAIEKDNIFGVQFHPEKSHDSGLKIIKNFVEKI